MEAEALALKQKLGDWFDPEWKDHARNLSEEEWIAAYESAWKANPQTCTNGLEMDEVLLEIPVGKFTVLEAGCGAGATVHALTLLGYVVTGLDVSHVALDLARERCRDLTPRPRWAQGFMEDLPFSDGEFHAAVCTHTLEHARDPELAAAELERVARNRIVVVVPRQEPAKYTPDYHLTFFQNEADLESLFHGRTIRCQPTRMGSALIYVGEPPPTA
jgi:2-polyprenyl-3-methyl-5-hydroxy-6-metoxy-1,4-benzoquinol methylase